MKKEFEMSQDDYNKLINAMKPQPVLKIGNHWTGLDRQERANLAWQELGDRMGFVGMTVEPSSKGKLFFFAEVKKDGE